MSSMLNCSNGVVIATGMVVSSTALILVISRQFSGNQTSPEDSPRPILRSCLSSGEKKKQRKKVQFAENVKETKGDGKEYRREQSRRIEPVSKPDKTGSVCKSEMPANRIALYHGILRDRDHRSQCSH